MFFHYTSSKLINLCNQSVQKFTVVRNYYHRTVKFTNSLFQHILGTHIQVVGRFVQYQEVYRFQQQFYHRQSAPLPSRKHLYFLVGSFPAKHKCPQYIAYFQAYISFGYRIYRIKNSQISIKQLRLILRKIADLYIVSYYQLSFVWNFIHDTFHES